MSQETARQRSARGRAEQRRLRDEEAARQLLRPAFLAFVESLRALVELPIYPSADCPDPRDEASVRHACELIGRLGRLAAEARVGRTATPPAAVMAFDHCWSLVEMAAEGATADALAAEIRDQWADDVDAHPAGWRDVWDAVGRGWLSPGVPPVAAAVPECPPPVANSVGPSAVAASLGHTIRGFAFPNATTVTYGTHRASCTPTPLKYLRAVLEISKKRRLPYPILETHITIWAGKPGSHIGSHATAIRKVLWDLKAPFAFEQFQEERVSELQFVLKEK